MCPPSVIYTICASIVVNWLHGTFPPFHSTNEMPVWWPLVTSSLINCHHPHLILVLIQVAKLTNLLSNISLSRFVANGKITWCERISALPARDHFLKEYHYPIQQLHLFTFIRIWKIFVSLSQVRPACYGIVLLYWYTCSYRPLCQICGSSLSCHTVHGGATLSDR